MTKYCPKEDKVVNLSLAIYCPDCGTLLTELARVDCPQCGWNQSGDNSFCIQCGEQLTEPNNISSDRPATSEELNKWHLTKGTQSQH